MPNGFLHACRAPRCPALLGQGQGSFCAQHSRPAWSDGRPGFHTRYPTDWETRRQRIMRRDQGLCVPCRQHGLDTTATSVDHVVAKAQGGSDEDSNLQSICVRCHATKSAREAAAGRWGQRGQP